MSVRAHPNPYVGLRPFFATDAHVFFGREEQIVELQEILHRTRFLPVVGGSGSGKSSLVRAGLIPRLNAGFLVAEADKWVTVTCKPGDAPINNLASALAQAFDQPAEVVDGEDGLEASLRLALAGGAGDFIDQHRNPKTSVLVLVDQFEELFAFRGPSSGDDDTLPDEVRAHLARRRAEAADFVDLLLGLAELPAPVYVVLTMRSDFLGDCDLFHGLPEAMNKARYLVPRLSREQLRQAVEGPAAMAGVKLTSRLVDKLVNALGDRADRLPMLQHALQRTYDKWVLFGATGPMDLEHYVSAGGIEKALEQDAEAALATVDAALAEHVLRALTDTDISQRRVRRPCRLDALARATGVDRAAVERVIDAFRADDRHFLYRARDGEVDNPRVDISHESLIRQWPRLSGWVDTERKARDAYLWLVQAARSEQAGERELMSGLEFTTQHEKWLSLGATRAWAERYGRASDDFDVTERFIERSREAVLAERQRLAEVARQVRRNRIRFFAGLALAGAALFAFVGWNLVRTRALLGEAQRSKRLAAIRDFSISDPTIAAALVAELPIDDAKSLEWSDITALRRIAGAQVALFVEDSAVDAQVARLPKTSRMAVLLRDGSIKVWASLDTLPRLLPRVANGVRMLTTDPALKRGVVTTARGELVAVDLESGAAHPIDGSSASAVAPARISRDGRTVLGFCEKGTASCLYSTTDTGRATAQVVLPADCQVVGQDLNPEGTRAVLACWSGDLLLWSPKETGRATYRVLSAHRHMDGRKRIDGGWREVRFSPDGRQIAAVCIAGDVLVLPVEGSGVREVKLGQEPTRLRFSNDGSLVAVGTDLGVALLDLKRATPSVRWYRVHTGGVTNVHFSMLGDTIVSSSLDGTAHVWTTSGACLDSASSRNTARITRRGCERIVFPGHAAAVTWANFTGDGSALVTLSDDGTARIWGTGHDPEPFVLRIREPVYKALLGPGDSTLAVVTASGHAVVHTLGHDEEAAQFSAPVRAADTLLPARAYPGMLARDVAFDGATMLLAANSTDSTRLFRVPRGQTNVVPIGSFAGVDGPRWLGPRGATATYLDSLGRAGIWRGMGQPLLPRASEAWERQFSDEEALVSADGRVVLSTRASSPVDGVAFLWSAADGKLFVQRLEGASGYARAFDRTGQRAAVSFKDNQVGLYEIPKDTAFEVAPYRKLSGARNRLLSIAFDGIASLVAAGDTAGGVNVWTAVAGRTGVLRLAGHEAAVQSVAFSEDNDHVITASEDSTVRIWTIAPSALIARIRSYTQVCVPPTVRVERLKEQPAQAEAELDACERRRRELIQKAAVARAAAARRDSTSRR